MALKKKSKKKKAKSFIKITFRQKGPEEGGKKGPTFHTYYGKYTQKPPEPLVSEGAARQYRARFNTSAVD